ncbi:MAG: DUF4838 domain-containing protein [Bacteroidales bacterium]|nr:DUF4838 domain-containing protein [Bacteroidales bacterium]
MQKILFYVFVIQILTSSSCKERAFKIDKENIGSISIVIPDTANSIVLFAADELKKHLDLVFGGNIPITDFSSKNKSGKQFLVGISPEGYSKKLNPEESVYLIRGNNIYIFGDDKINIRYSADKPGEFKNKIQSEALNLANNRAGTLFAVYNFLENELDVKWIKPGDDGIFYPKLSSVTIAIKDSAWTPVLLQRNIRPEMLSFKIQNAYGQCAPKEFSVTKEESFKKYADLLIWMRRMRMGRSENFRFGHAYGSYWENYKNTNPDIFALTSKGVRKPMGRVERVKMCPTNTELPKIKVNEWRDDLQKNPYQNSKSISGCENDSDGYGNDEWCHCDNCMAIDARKEGEDLTDYVTDRYVHLWNSILKEARQVKDDIMVTGYAYENMLQPPRNEKLDDGILIEFIPRMGGDFAVTKKLYEGWQEAGMKKMMYRPNDLWWEMGIPMGQEQRLFENFKLGIAHNAIGTDFDALMGYWEGISDMTYYILAKGNANPNSTFEELEEEYLNSFGEAKDDIAKYYRHWRNIFTTKVIPEELRLNNGIKTYFLEYGLLYRLTERIDEFYSLEDFNLTDSYLKNAAEKNISDQARNYIRRMQIANENSRLTVICFMAGKNGNKDQIISKANDLLNFRLQNRDKVDINWNVLFQAQHHQMHDQTGMRYLGFLPKNIDTSEF